MIIIKYYKEVKDEKDKIHTPEDCGECSYPSLLTAQTAHLIMTSA
jgi:hypothetical protein